MIDIAAYMLLLVLKLRVIKHYRPTCKGIVELTVYPHFSELPQGALMFHSSIWLTILRRTIPHGTVNDLYTKCL